MRCRRSLEARDRSPCLHTFRDPPEKEEIAASGIGEGSVETWKFVALFLVIWLPLWAYFETLVRVEDESDR
jgi:hypothetical protein